MKRKKLLWASVLFFMFSITSAYSQGYMGYMLTKTLLDSVKVNKLHGTAGLSLKVEQTDNIKFELDVATELVYALDKHKFRFSGNIAYNFLNDIDTGNKGFFHLQGDFFQYRIENNIREKTPFFFSANATYNYDYLRNLNNRVALGMNFTFQPLREHPNLCIEPGIGIGGTYQHWDALDSRAKALGVERSALLESFNNLPIGSKEYLRITEKGNYNQLNFRFNAFVNFFGDWDHIAFHVYTAVQQPISPSFKQQSYQEEQLPAEFKGLLNTKVLPLVGAGGFFQVKIWKGLAAVTRLDFLYDGGQAPVDSYNLTYCFTQGLSYSW
jgi:hypothetical protein